MCCLNIGGDLERSVFTASSLELGPSSQGGPRSEGDIKMVENGSKIEGPSRHRMTSKKLDIVETDFEKIKCDGY